jgi:hypothetical protein
VADSGGTVYWAVQWELMWAVQCVDTAVGGTFGIKWCS